MAEGGNDEPLPPLLPDVAVAGQQRVLRLFECAYGRVCVYLDQVRIVRLMRMFTTIFRVMTHTHSAIRFDNALPWVLVLRNHLLAGLCSWR